MRNALVYFNFMFFFLQTFSLLVKEKTQHTQSTGTDLQLIAKWFFGRSVLFIFIFFFFLAIIYFHLFGASQSQTLPAPLLNFICLPQILLATQLASKWKVLAHHTHAH